MAKHEFLLHYELESVFDGFSDEQAGKLIKAMFDYEKRREVQAFDDPLLEMMFNNVIRPKLDENLKRYEETCKRMRQNVQTRWSRYKEKKNTNDTSRYNSIQNVQEYTNDTSRYKAIQNIQVGVDIDNDNDKSLSISNESLSNDPQFLEAQKTVKDFLELLGDRKISPGKKLKLMQRYKEMRKTKQKEDVDRELLDFLAEE